MNIQRARQIADSFAHVAALQVQEVSGGLRVTYNGHSCYFVRESCFWPFVSRVAGAALGDVAEIEMRLAA